MDRFFENQTDLANWSHCCSNGVITIGTIVTLLSPAPIRNMMANDIPMLESRFPVSVMKEPEEFHSICVNEGIQGIKSKAFVLHRCDVSVI